MRAHRVNKSVWIFHFSITKSRANLIGIFELMAQTQRQVSSFPNGLQFDGNIESLLLHFSTSLIFESIHCLKFGNLQHNIESAQIRTRCCYHLD